MSTANAEITFNNTHPMPGETISFSGHIRVCDSGYHRFLVKMPSGEYVQSPSFLKVNILHSEQSNYCYKEYDINGTIKIGKDFVPGEYVLVFDFTNSLSDYIRRYPFTVGNYSKEWRYKFSYPGGNWDKEAYDDSGWRIGYMPFGNPSLFSSDAINTTWKTGEIYLRREVYLDNYAQATLRMFAENRVECWVNGNYVGSHNSISAMKTGNCYENDWVNYHGISVQATSGSYSYHGIKIIDISKFLKPGKNVIACKAKIFNKVYRRCVYWPNCYYYHGRQYVDVEFDPLQKDYAFWEKYNRNDWNKPNIMGSTYWKYSCTEVGSTHTTYKYVMTKDWEYNNWQWSNLSITDDTTFYHKPNHFNWAQFYHDRRVYWGVSPFNKKTTYFRKWIWSDRDKYVVLKLSATKEPTCYVNGEKIDIWKYNTDYWNYYSDIKLNKGTNLIACQQSPVDFNLFDLTTSGFDGKLKISNVTTTKDGDKVNLTVTLENLAHPEVNSLVDVEINNSTFTTYVSNATISTENLTGIVDVPYYSNSGRLVWNNYSNLRYGSRVSDGRWGTYAFPNKWDKDMIVEKRYKYTSNITLNELTFKYKFQGASTVYFFNYSDDKYDKIASYNSTTPIIKTITLNSTDYISKEGYVQFKVVLNNSVGNVKYYEDVVYVNGSRGIYTNFTKINSISTTVVQIPNYSGNITISAIDLIDGDIDVFPTVLNFESGAGAAVKVGFLPFGGDAEGGNSAENGGNKVMLMIATTAIASASAIAVFSRSTSTPLKRLETSLSKSEKIVARLQGYRSFSIRQNLSAYRKMLYEKYLLFKEHMKEKKKEEARVEAIRQYLIELEEQAKKEWLNEMSKELRELMNNLSGTNEEMIRQIDDFLTKHDLPYEQAMKVLNYRRFLFAQIFGISTGDVEKFVKEFADKYGLSGYVHLGRWADKLRLIIDDPRWRRKFRQFVDEKMSEGYIPLQDSDSGEVESGDGVIGVGFGDDESQDNNSLIGNLGGALSGLGKYLNIRFNELISKFKDVGGSLLEGDIRTALSKFFGYTKDDISFLARVIKNNGKELLLSIMVGLVAGAIITMTGGVGTPAALAIATAMLGMGAIQLGGKYSEALNELNNADTDEEIESAYARLKEMIVGDVVVITTGIISAGIGGSVAKGISIEPNGVSYEISTPEGLTVELPESTVEEVGNTFETSWSYGGELVDPDAFYFNELISAGVPQYRIDKMLSFGFESIKVDYVDLDAPLGIDPTDGSLVVNPSLLAELSDNAFEFGLWHEHYELKIPELQHQGKILSNNAIKEKVNELQIPEEMKGEVYDIIRERLIADKLVLKNHPELLDGWKEEASDLLKEIYNLNNPYGYTEDQLKNSMVKLAYLKVLSPDDNFVMWLVDNVINNLSDRDRFLFNQIINLMRMVVGGV